MKMSRRPHIKQAVVSNFVPSRITWGGFTALKPGMSHTNEINPRGGTQVLVGF